MTFSLSMLLQCWIPFVLNDLSSIDWKWIFIFQYIDEKCVIRERRFVLSTAYVRWLYIRLYKHVFLPYRQLWQHHEQHQHEQMVFPLDLLPFQVYLRLFCLVRLLEPTIQTLIDQKVHHRISLLYVHQLWERPYLNWLVNRKRKIGRFEECEQYTKWSDLYIHEEVWLRFTAMTH